jgi:hypothetical protein
MDGKLEALAARARPGTLGISVIDVETGHQWGVNQVRYFRLDARRNRSLQ